MRRCDPCAPCVDVGKGCDAQTATARVPAECHGSLDCCIGEGASGDMLEPQRDDRWAVVPARLAADLRRDTYAQGSAFVA